MKQRIFAGRTVRMAGVALLGAGILALAGCFYMPGLSSRGPAQARVAVSGLPPNTELTGSFTLIVGGPGMSSIVNTYPVGTNTTGPITFPSGLARTFTLLANTASVTLIGQSTMDLAPGETKEVVLMPVAAGSQIIVPDYWNNRIAQFADMAGTGWQTLTYSAFDPLGQGGGSLWPWAIDFDSQGKIYVANGLNPNTGAAAGGSILGGLFRFDDINHPTTAATLDTSSYFTSLAIDRARGIVYYSNGSILSVFAKDVSNIAAAAATVDLSDISAITARLNISSFVSMAADENGVLYLAFPASDFPGAIIKFDPNAPLGSRVLANSANSTYSFLLGVSSPSGVVVNGPYVYVSDKVGKQIVRFDRNLQFVDSFPGPSGTPFYGPENFVATLNRKITVIDEGGAGGPDRLASFEDTSGAGWQTFGSTGTGTNLFLFYTS